LVFWSLFLQQLARGAADDDPEGAQVLSEGTSKSMPWSGDPLIVFQNRWSRRRDQASDPQWNQRILCSLARRAANRAIQLLMLDLNYPKDRIIQLPAA
jgi:hypothetical protein